MGVICRSGRVGPPRQCLTLPTADIGILIDGVEGWSALGLPLETS